MTMGSRAGGASLRITNKFRSMTMGSRAGGASFHRKAKVFSLPGGPGGFLWINLQNTGNMTPFCRNLVALLLAVLLEGTHEGSLVLGVWNLPWPNLELVSMNLRLIFSRALFLVWVRRDFLKVRVRFLGPMQHPLIMMKSCLTSP